MNWDKLYQMQDKLDGRIKKQHNLNGKDLFDEKVMALLVEVGELANETRCFKYWSTKGPNEQSVILEEYVDGLHFILSLGIDMNYFFKGEEIELTSPPPDTLTEQFLAVYDQIRLFHTMSTMDHYNNLCIQYVRLGIKLGFTTDMIEQAYLKKNELNHERQDQGY
ncbi:dimeric dUTPase (all-alpha-NTP-PPase superfamily) [Melghiribacillus thermohalophilus]|uniref:Dimeric dUTPase (All-alpha-NTP-PPase superfamily) n=1 Tax=Melghiribacillus thermohalophilus TaxID=1324956 RepID=A0A4R3N7C4_9BACI|nr:dUTP diphosphatase [Melghiribacillus thermohalophilus]TCT25035.1 dimeric dUTPase (all-alpha-NTP-PPase superfamily) [Melghiribacillus thermohalophilus]